MATTTHELSPPVTGEIGNPLAGWLLRHPTVKQRELAALMRCPESSVSKWAKANGEGGGVLPGDNAGLIEQATRALDPTDAVELAAWEPLRRARAARRVRRAPVTP